MEEKTGLYFLSHMLEDLCLFDVAVIKLADYLFFLFKDIKIRCIIFISLITDKRLGTRKPSMLSIKKLTCRGPVEEFCTGLFI